MRLNRQLLLSVGAACLLACAPAFAAPPSQAQVDELMEAMDARKMIDQMLPALMQQSQQMALQAMPAEGSAEDRAKLERMMEGQHRAMAQAMNWDRLQPMFSRVYAQVFTTAEVQAMIDFYRSPEGSSAMAKMPQAMQLSMVEMQPIMMELMQSFERELAETFGD